MKCNNRIPLRHPPNIMIVGCAGSGKSTLAKELGKIAVLQVIHMDRIQWKPYWVTRNQEEMNLLIEKAVKSDGWVFEGNNSASYHLRAPKAHLLIWLDIPRSICLRRAILRTLKNYYKQREDLPKGCYERFSWDFMKWVWNFNTNSRPKIEALFSSRTPDLEKIRLNSREEVSQFLEDFRGLYDAP